MVYENLPVKDSLTKNEGGGEKNRKNKHNQPSDWCTMQLRISPQLMLSQFPSSSSANPTKSPQVLWHGATWCGISIWPV